MTATDQPPAVFDVPTIDLAPYVADSQSPQALQIIQQVRHAAMTTGFFQLIGHGIPRELQEAVFKGSAAFFALPLDIKQSLDQSHSVGASNRGYELIGSQGLQDGTLPDLKEGFYIGKDIPATDPRVQASAFLMGPNLYPPSELIPDSVFKEPMLEYYDRVFKLALVVLETLARGMPYGDNVFDEFTSNDPVASIRLLHYPPQTSTEEKQLGAGAHTDFGAITLLLQDDQSGLQVHNPAADEWVAIAPNPDAYVVNIGDMLSMWTRGLYKSSLHRVLNFSTRDRYSIPFFFDGNIGCRLAPFDGEEVDGEVLTVEQHMKERFSSTYGRGKKDLKGTS